MTQATIQVVDVKKTLQGREILKGINFQVNRGDIFGFLGPNGAGKTTTIRIIMGLYQADSGNVSILGENVERSEVRNKVGFVLDKDGLYDGMSAEANLAYYLKIYGQPVVSSTIDKALEMVGLKDRARDKIGVYSKGMRQRAALARAIVHDPDVLILDEPTSGVDPSEQINIRNMLLSIAKEGNKTVFLSTHNMDEVQKICNRIALLNKGEIQLYGGVEELRNKMGSNVVTVQTTGVLSDEIRRKLELNSKLGFQFLNEHHLVFSLTNSIKTPDLVNILASYGIEIEEVKKDEISIEDMYSEIVKESV